MSPNVLSDRLKRLEAESLITRHYERALPPRVEYNLTEKGWSVRPILLALLEFSRAQLSPSENLIEEMPVDFAVRVVPTFAFQPAAAAGLDATLLVEIDDCTDCSRWTFRIRDGHIMPRRQGSDPPDAVLRTSSRQFFRFIRGEVTAEECGQVEGPMELVSAVQACFVPVTA